MPSFISTFLDYTKPYESPTSFWKWAAYAAIGATLRDNAWIADGDSRIYPNLYILFLAGSGGRKDRPIRVIDDLLTQCNSTKVISGRSSIQGILDELSRSETSAKTGKVIPAGAAIWLAPELSAGIVEDSAAVSILTDIYDGKTNFQSILRHSPKFRIDRIVFSALMGSNENMLRSVYDTKATYGGLLARTLLVIPNEIRPPNSLMGMGSESIQAEIKKTKENLITCLKAMGEALKGPFHFASDAIEEHERWYKPFYWSFTKGGDKAGVSARIQTNIKKMSMILAANAGEQSIRRPHMEEAIDVCTALLTNYNTLVMAAGKSLLADASALVIKTLAEQVEYLISKRDLLAMHWSDLDAETLDKVISTLEQGGVIETHTSSSGMFIRLTKKTIERMGLK